MTNEDLNQLPLYRSHKQVRAAKIVSVLANKDPNAEGMVEVKRPDGMHQFVTVPPGFFARAMPKLGDYLVVYRDGYMSHSPAQEFEGGYTLVGCEAQKAGPVLMSAENPTGWKLEELLAQLAKELDAKTKKIAAAGGPAAKIVARNNLQIGGLLMQASALQYDSLDALAAIGPDQGPTGKPRIGGGPCVQAVEWTSGGGPVHVSLSDGTKFSANGKFRFEIQLAFTENRLVSEQDIARWKAGKC